MEQDILMAIKLNPNYAQARLWHSGLLSSRDQYEDALVQIQVAAELDPLSSYIQTRVATAVWNTGRAEEALTLIRRNIERTPEFLDNYETMAQFQVQLGQLGKALRWIREARKLNPEGAFLWNWECRGLLALGDEMSAETCIRQLITAHPKNPLSLILRMPLHGYRGEWEAAKAALELLWAGLPGWDTYTRMLAFLTAMQGDLELARKLMAESFPWMLEDGLEIAVNDLNTAIVFAAILNASGEIQRRDVLLLAVEERIATLHRIRGHGFGILDVYIHAMRGDRDQAIAALREAIDSGWRTSWAQLDSSWWLLEDDWRLASLHQDPEFIVLVEELETDIEAQRQWYEENKDQPLF